MKKLKNLDEEIVYDLMCEDGYARVLIDRKTEMLFRKSDSNNLFVTVKKGKKKKCDFMSCCHKSDGLAISEAMQIARAMYERI